MRIYKHTTEKTTVCMSIYDAGIKGLKSGQLSLRYMIPAVTISWFYINITWNECMHIWVYELMHAI